ncbi:MAG: VWA domain-containing protein [Alcanivoracaceae bacterium]|nr:VWA domain-containing protein [Alcanivoracaceae bacterium]
MTKTRSAQLIYILLINFLLVCSVWASTPMPFEISFEFPEQGKSIKHKTQINVILSNTPQWESYVIELDLSAVTFVEPESHIANLHIDKRIEVNSRDENGVTAIPLTVFENGEYEIKVSIALKTSKGIVNRFRTFGVVAESGLIWFGRDTVGHAIKSKVRYQIESDPSVSTKSIEQEYKQKLNAEEQNRAIRSRANDKKTNNQPKTQNNKTIVNGDILIFAASWVGQGTGKLNTTTGDFNFPMHGVKITISDKDLDINNMPLTANIEGYLIDGEFTFVAPRDNYSYRVVIETDFPGINANGDIDITGNSSIGAFKVLKETANGGIYTCQTENILAVVCNQAQTGSNELASAWSAFHGMAEMVKQAKLQLTVDKQSNFNVIFNHSGSGSAYDPNTNEIFISLGHRYEWDVVAHEFGHAIANETNATDTNTGGPHNGSNQYDYQPNNSTLHNKTKSLELAINEGFGTWFGTALLQNPSASYNGRFKGISDSTYDDASQLTSANLEGNKARLLSSVPTAYGEDTEVAILHLLWDLMDSNNESNTRANCVICRDSSSLNLSGLWNVFKDSNVSSIIEFYQVLLQKAYGTNVTDLLILGENNISDTGLRGALNISNTFTEFGIAPYLEKPLSKTKLDLVIDTSGPVFEWSQQKTGTLEGLTEFTLALYTFDLKTLVFKKPGITSNTYTLTNQDIIAIKSEVDNLFTLPSSLIAVVIGENDYLFELESGPYISNPKEIMINNVDRTLVVVVDSSGSNTTTDPDNLRIEAAKETLRNLTSLVEAQSLGSAPDLAAAVDFDSTVTILSELDDPDTVINTLNTIDSSGSTDIAAGINAAVQILENLNTTGLSGIIEDKAAIALFTDGENNAGQTPVIQAIVNATLKGIRVHYGFLSPITSNISEPLFIPSDATQGYTIPETSTNFNGTLPTTVEEAVYASGGVFAFIGNANSQVAFVTQVKNRGFTNADNTDPGGQSVANQTETFDILNDPLSTRSFQFNGVVDAYVFITVDTNGNFHPFLKIIDINGNNIEIDNDTDNNGIIDLSFTLPYSGDYHAEITSQDGATGSYSFQIEGIGVEADIIFKNGFEEIIGVPVISSFTANPDNITMGGNTNLTWTLNNNATSCIKSGDWTGSANSSNGINSQVVSNITSTSSYSLQCFNSFGSSQVKSVQVLVTNPGLPPTLSLSANPTTINSGESSVISWTVGNGASICTKSGNWSGTLTGSDVTNGTHTDTVTNITTSSNYNLVCTNNFGSSTFQSVQVLVINPSSVPTLTMSANPTTISSGGSSIISWTVGNDATACTKFGGWSGTFTGSDVTNGTHSLNIANITVNSTYSLVCTNSFGSSPVRSVQVLVIGTGSPPPTLTLSANPTIINSGESSIISWIVNNDASSCTKTGNWSGILTGNDVTNGTHSTTITNITSNSSFSLVCSNSIGTSPVRTVTVTINGGNPDCISQPPILNGNADTTIRLIPGAPFGQLGSPQNPASFNGTYDSIAPGSGWPGIYGAQSIFNLTANQYTAMRFTTDNSNAIARLVFTVPGNGQGPPSSATTIAISECPGDFTTHLGQSRCLIRGGAIPNMLWSQNPNTNPAIYCLLEKIKHITLMWFTLIQ